MTEQTPDVPAQDSDYDGAWKEALRRFFQWILQCYFPRPDEDRFQLADFESRTRFPVCKLIDRLRTDWRDDHSLPVQLARAQIAALRTAGDPEGRYRAKWQLVRNLYEIGYNAEQVRELFGLIDWMMHLRVDLEEQFKQELDELEESLHMPYVTSVERIAKTEGRIEAGIETRQQTLIRQLRRRFGNVPATVTRDINATTATDQLDDWLDRLVTANSLEELDIQRAGIGPDGGR